MSVSLAAVDKENDREAVNIDYQRMIYSCQACHTAFRERVAVTLSRALVNKATQPPSGGSLE